MGHKFRIELAPRGQLSRVWMDGTELTCVRGVQVEAHVDSASVVRLELLGSVDIEGEAGVLWIDKPKSLRRVAP